MPMPPLHVSRLRLALALAIALPPAPAAARPGLPAAASKATARAPGPAADPPPDSERLEQILRSAPGKPRAYALVVDLESGRTILSVRPDEPVYPASTAKLFTTAAVLRTFSPRTRLYTELRIHRRGRRPGAPVTLSIVGGGDPSLSMADLRRLAARVRAAGIRRVGRLVVDDTIFDRKLPTGFDEKETDAPYRAPVGGLQVDSSAVLLRIERGPKVGSKPMIAVRPPSPAVRIDNRVTMVRGRGRPLAVAILGEGRRTLIRVTGRMGRKRRRIAVRKRVHDASYFAGEIFRRLLEDAGVRVAGRTVYGPAPRGSKRIARHASRPLIELVRYCAQHSHNGYAETFFKLLGARLTGRPGSSSKGSRATREALRGLGIDWKKITLANGSGLYHADRVTPRQVVALLVGMARLGGLGERWRSTLAIAGVAGTLRARLRGPATRRRIFAKTGTLDDVTALAGYALGPSRRYAFALYYNRVQRPARLYRRVHDRFLSALLDPAGSAISEKR